ncbi:MAG: alpha/beta fold hydrolase [Rhodospirillaceae bacterium]
MGMISIGDAELNVDVTGEGDPLLMVSGLGGRAAFWSHQVSAFSEHFQVITHDHRGTGASTKSNIKYSVAQMSEDVIRLLDALSIPTVTVLGHSTGGAIAQFLALKHTERVNRIVLSASWPGPSPYFQELFRLRLRILQDSGPDAYLIDGIMRAYPSQILSEKPEILSGSREERLATFPGIKIESSRINAVLSHDLRSQISSISLPTLVIGAADDQITPKSFFDELADEIVGAEKVIFPFGGHFLPQVKPREYNQALFNFLNVAG